MATWKNSCRVEKSFRWRGKLVLESRFKSKKIIPFLTKNGNSLLCEITRFYLRRPRHHFHKGKHLFVAWPFILGRDSGVAFFYVQIMAPPQHSHWGGRFCYSVPHLAATFLSTSSFLPLFILSLFISHGPPSSLFILSLSLSLSLSLFFLSLESRLSLSLSLTRLSTPESTPLTSS